MITLNLLITISHYIFSTFNVFFKFFTNVINFFVLISLTIVIQTWQLEVTLYRTPNYVCQSSCISVNLLVSSFSSGSFEIWLIRKAIEQLESNYILSISKNIHRQKTTCNNTNVSVLHYKLKIVLCRLANFMRQGTELVIN